MLGKILVAASLLSAFTPTAVAAQEKMALLIGNSNYEQQPDGYSWSALPNPVNDVEVVGEALEAIDFAVIVVSMFSLQLFSVYCRLIIFSQQNLAITYGL